MCVSTPTALVKMHMDTLSKRIQEAVLEQEGVPEQREVDQPEEEVAEPNTYWVRQDELLHTIRLSDVEEALEQRQEAVLAALRPQKKARK